MSEQQFQPFLNAAKEDQALQEKLKAALTPQDIVTIAKEAGFSISADQLQRGKSELSEQELESVAGGTLYWPSDNPHQRFATVC